MIDKIPLPTDNLYKFMALFGLTIFALSFIPGYRRDRIHMESLDTVVEMIKSKNDDKNLKTDSFIWVEPNDLDAAVYEIKRDRRNRTMYFEFTIGLLMKIFGILLMYYGFRLWYQRLQKYQDMIIKKQAGEVEVKKSSFSYKPKLP